MANVYLSESANYLNKRKAKALYEDWFKTFNKDNYKKVKEFF